MCSRTNPDTNESTGANCWFGDSTRPGDGDRYGYRRFTFADNRHSSHSHPSVDSKTATHTNTDTKEEPWWVSGDRGPAANFDTDSLANGNGHAGPEPHTDRDTRATSLTDATADAHSNCDTGANCHADTSADAHTEWRL